MRFKETLYGKNKAGKIIQWEIHVEGDSYWTVHGQRDKKLTTSLPTVAKVTNAGRSNERNPEQQALFEAEADYTKKKKEGYSEDITKAGEKHYPDAQTAYELDDYKDEIVFPAIAQTKFNGVRVLSNDVGCWSREGEEWLSTRHIKLDLEKFFQDYPTAMVDGEYFNFELREHLNELVSIVRKRVDISEEDYAKAANIVRLVVYDGYLRIEDAGKPYSVRFKELSEVLKQYTKYIDIAESVAVNNMSELIAFYEKQLAMGQEGVMLRWGDTGYIFGRTKYILKCKPVITDEFILLKVEEGEGNWAGAAKRIFFKRPSDGAEFKGSFKGKRSAAKKFLAEWEQYKGQLVTVEYTSLTGLGIPNFARLDVNNFLRADGKKS